MNEYESSRHSAQLFDQSGFKAVTIQNDHALRSDLQNENTHPASNIIAASLVLTLSHIFIDHSVQNNRILEIEASSSILITDMAGSLISTRFLVISDTHG